MSAYAEIDWSLPTAFFRRCTCGHLWMWHDVNEYRGDGSEMCCVEDCSQVGCPGRTKDGDP